MGVGLFKPLSKWYIKAIALPKLKLLHKILIYFYNYSFITVSDSTDK